MALDFPKVGRPDRGLARKLLVACDNDEAYITKWNRYRKEHPEWTPDICDPGNPLDSQSKRFCYSDGKGGWCGINLHGAKLSGAGLLHADLRGADLGDANLEGAKLNGAQLVGVSGLRTAILRNTSFGSTNLSGVDLTGVDLTIVSTFKAAILINALLNNTDLSGADLNHAKLNGATLKRADLRKCNMLGVTVRDANFTSAKGLFGLDHANVEDVQDAEFATYCYSQDWIPWSLLRGITTLRIFGASYGAFIAITVYVLLSKYWNAKLIGVHEWATKHEHELSIRFWVGLVERIPPLPVPDRLGWQLIMLGVLAAGATLYAWFCPEIIKGATETRWTRELKQPLIEYRSAMYSKFIRRYVCALCYGTGGLYTLWYIGRNGVDAIWFLMF